MSLAVGDRAAGVHHQQSHPKTHRGPSRGARCDRRGQDPGSDRRSREAGAVSLRMSGYRRQRPLPAFQRRICRL